jgi:hypothetical protein
MNIKIIFVSLLILTIISCTKTRVYTIDLCTNLSLNIKCDPSLTTIKPGEKFYVLFECNQLFIENKIKGTFYYIENSNRKEVSSQEWNITAGESYIYYYTYLNNIGVYEIEFTNEKGQSLATKKLEIKE